VILVDTGVLYAAADDGDVLHAAATDWLAVVTDELIVPTPIAVETAWLLDDRLGPEHEANFLRSLNRKEMTRVDLTDDDWQRVEDLVVQYSDLQLGTADSSIVVIAERLGIEVVATFNDRDFRVVRPRHIDAFTLVPRPLS